MNPTKDPESSAISVVHHFMILFSTQKPVLPRNIPPTAEPNTIKVLNPAVYDFLFNPTNTAADKTPSEINPLITKTTMNVKAIPKPTPKSIKPNPSIAIKNNPGEKSSSVFNSLLVLEIEIVSRRFEVIVTSLKTVSLLIACVARNVNKINTSSNKQFLSMFLDIVVAD